MIESLAWMAPPCNLAEFSIKLEFMTVTDELSILKTPPDPTQLLLTK